MLAELFVKSKQVTKCLEGEKKPNNTQNLNNKIRIKQHLNRKLQWHWKHCTNRISCILANKCMDLFEIIKLFLNIFLRLSSALHCSSCYTVQHHLPPGCPQSSLFHCGCFLPPEWLRNMAVPCHLSRQISRVIFTHLCICIIILLQHLWR